MEASIKNPTPTNEGEPSGSIEAFTKFGDRLREKSRDDGKIAVKDAIQLFNEIGVLVGYSLAPPSSCIEQFTKRITALSDNEMFILVERAEAAFKDVDLVERIRLGQRDSAQFFFDKFERIIYSKIIRSVSSDDKDDTFNNFFIHLAGRNYRRITQWSGKAALPTYIVGILNNFLIDQSRVRAPQIDSNATSEFIESVADFNTDTPEDHMGVLQLENCMDFAIKQLNPRHKEVISRSFYNDQSTDEISQALGVTQNHFYGIKMQAFIQWKAAMNEHCPEIVRRYM